MGESAKARPALAQYPDYRPNPGELPTSPGVYRFIDAQGRIIYVGKAKNLRQRVSSYFPDLNRLHPRTAQMVTTARAVEWTIVGSEVEALSLEYAWIKEFSPTFNVLFRDDKSYPYLAVSLAEDVPRVFVTRAARKPGIKYFGPYPHVGALRQTLGWLQPIFPVRTCASGVYRRAQAAGRPCLLGYIDKCSAPCVGRISAGEHRVIVEDICAFLGGQTGKFTSQLRAQMKQAAADLDFEQAAVYRDRLAALERVMEKNAIVLDTTANTDFYALAADDLQVAVQCFRVRSGRIRSTQAWLIELTGYEDTPEELMLRLLTQVYTQLQELDRGSQPARSVDDVKHLDANAVPPEILLSVMPADCEVLQDYLQEIRGARVEIKVPQRGTKKELLARVEENAEQALELAKTRRINDLTARSEAINALGQALGLPTAALGIECYDISHAAGQHQVGSMVVFADGLPVKAQYRRFNIRGEDGTGARDDTEALAEVLRRRFSRAPVAETDRQGLLPDGDDEGLGGAPDCGERGLGPVASAQVGVDLRSLRVRRFAYDPDLLVVDGGLPQVNAAAATLRELGVTVPVVGLAKRLEEVWIPGEEYPLILPRQSAALYLLQQLRDESHRFAINAHRKQRRKDLTQSALDGIPGLGPKRAQALMRAFGSVKRIKKASVEQLAQCPGIGPGLAKVIHDQLQTKVQERPS